jgi:hypothetical protein
VIQAGISEDLRRPWGGSSKHGLLADALGDVSFPGLHGLAHSPHVCTTHVLRAIHLAVGHDALPRVRTVTLLLDALVVCPFGLSILLPSQLKLLLAVASPPQKILATLCLSVALQTLLSLLLLKERSFAVFVGSLNGLDTLFFFLIEKIFLSRWLRADASFRGETPSLGRRLETFHAALTLEAVAPAGEAAHHRGARLESRGPVVVS